VASRRRHRPLLGLSGLTLFVCLFLPAVQVCDTSQMPLDRPGSIPPYIYGAAFVVCAVLGTRRWAIQIAANLVRLLTLAHIVFAIGMLAAIEPLGVVELLAAVAVLGTLGVGAHESRLALVPVVVGVGSAVWFAILLATGDARYGAWLSFASSLGVAIAGLLWRHDITAEDPAAALPRATARER
jgi:hypothetical protein